MAGTDDYLWALFELASAEEAFLNRLRHTEHVQPKSPQTHLDPAPSVSLMITNRQRAELREHGFSEESIRTMTPAEAHAQLGLNTPSG
jgi:hypothetical protein